MEKLFFPRRCNEDSTKYMGLVSLKIRRDGWENKRLTEINDGDRTVCRVSICSIAKHATHIDTFDDQRQNTSSFSLRRATREQFPRH
jgi:hypothetical protein